MTGQTRFGHVTFPRSRASEVPESRFVTIGFGIVPANPDVLNVVPPLEVCKSRNEGLAVVGDDLHKSAPVTEDVLEDPVAECLGGLLAEHAVLWVMSEGATSLDNIRETPGAWEVHSVHIHLGE